MMARAKATGMSDVPAADLVAFARAFVVWAEGRGFKDELRSRWDGWEERGHPAGDIPEGWPDDLPAGVLVSGEFEGAAGGNCWGGQAKSFVAAALVPRLLSVAAFLDECLPGSMTWRQGRALLDRVRREDRVVTEYYGNWHRAVGESLTFASLHAGLAKAGLVPRFPPTPAGPGPR